MPSLIYTCPILAEAIQFSYSLGSYVIPPPLSTDKNDII